MFSFFWVLFLIRRRAALPPLKDLACHSPGVRSSQLHDAAGPACFTAPSLRPLWLKIEFLWVYLADSVFFAHTPFFKAHPQLCISSVFFLLVYSFIHVKDVKDVTVQHLLLLRYRSKWEIRLWCGWHAFENWCIHIDMMGNLQLRSKRQHKFK